MITQLLDICDTLKTFKGFKINPNYFLGYMKVGIANKTVFYFVEYVEGKLKGCIVLQKMVDFKGSVLNGVWCWIDPHYPKLYIKMVKAVDKLASEQRVDRITLVTQRNENAILRKLSKYGYKAKYTIFEKDVIQ